MIENGRDDTQHTQIDISSNEDAKRMRLAHSTAVAMFNNVWDTLMGWDGTSKLNMETVTAYKTVFNDSMAALDSYLTDIEVGVK